MQTKSAVLNMQRYTHTKIEGVKKEAVRYKERVCVLEAERDELLKEREQMINALRMGGYMQPQQQRQPQKDTYTHAHTHTGRDLKAAVATTSARKTYTQIHAPVHTHTHTQAYQDHEEEEDEEESPPHTLESVNSLQDRHFFSYRTAKSHTHTHTHTPNQAETSYPNVTCVKVGGCEEEEEEEEEEEKRNVDIAAGGAASLSPPPEPLRSWPVPLRLQEAEEGEREEGRGQEEW